MSDITELILTKYYGLSVDPENKKFVTSYCANYDPRKFYRSSETNDSSEIETIAETSGNRANSEAQKDEVEDSIVGDTTDNKIIRSSRAILDDESLEDEKNDINELETLLESSPPQKERSPGEESKTSEGKDLLTPKKIEITEDSEEIDRKNSLSGNIDDVLPDNVSDISSIPVKKKPRTKSALTAASTISQRPQLPKKLPACNGVFLDLTNLCLAEFPVNMLGNLPNLRMLYLENNSLTELPRELFTSLRLLQWLDLRNNRLTTLPDTIKYHPTLETILLEGNLFEKLPIELCLLPNLKGLQTSRNPLIFPPTDILALGFAATINYLRTEWNKLHPDEIVESPERDRKPRPSTILCSDPPISRTSSKSTRLFASSSMGHVSESKISVREKIKNYKPSNRCENRGANEELEARLLWIAEVKKMLMKQSAALQKIKDREALGDWRRDRRSYEKSIIKAANRTEEDIPYAIDMEDMAMIFKNRFKKSTKKIKSRSRDSAPRNINEKMMELYESLKRLQETRKSENVTPRSEQKLLENQIKKLSELQDEIQNLQRHNAMSTAPFEGSALLPVTHPYKPPPSIII